MSRRVLKLIIVPAAVGYIFGAFLPYRVVMTLGIFMILCLIVYYIHLQMQLARKTGGENERS